MPITRKSARTPLNADLLLRRVGGTNYRVHIYDLSPLGCKVEFVERPKIDEHLWVKFEGLEAIEAIVCWVQDHTVGLKFERAIHPAVFDSLVSGLSRPL